jgi:hypothetical protein
VHDVHLAASALDGVQSFLQSGNSDLTGPGLQAVTALLRTLEDGLRSNLPGSYFLASLDPGMGKTLTVTEFLKAWKANGYSPSSSVLVCVARREEIGRYMTDAGLTKDEVAVVTSYNRNEDFEDWRQRGVAEDQHQSARIMFTTHAMVQSRTKNRGFATLREFYFEGAPRALRVWDESMVPDAPPLIRMDDLALLAAPLRHKHPAFVKALQAFQMAVWSAPEGEMITIPTDLSVLAEAASKADSGHKELLKQLAALGDQELMLLDGDNGDMNLVGAARSMANGLAPALILDASGRVRRTYDLWSEHRGQLVRLPAAHNDYRQLEVHLWQRGSGKNTLNQPGRRLEIADAVAKVINDDPDRDAQWLIVHYKADQDIFPMIQDRVEHGATERLKKLTWGRHQATNEFLHVRNVVVIGQLTYRKLDYLALACAASGLRPAELGDDFDVDDLRWSEFQHHLLQALCRASVRKGANGIAGACRAYVIATPDRQQTEVRVRETFPGCQLHAWEPVQRGPSATVQEAMAFLRKHLPLGLMDSVSKRQVREHLGIEAKNFGRDVVSDKHFQAFLKAQGMDETHHGFRRKRATFEPYPGGGFTVDQLDTENAEV